MDPTVIVFVEDLIATWDELIDAKESWLHCKSPSMTRHPRDVVDSPRHVWEQLHASVRDCGMTVAVLEHTM